MASELYSTLIIFLKKVYFYLVLVSSCKQLQENQAVAWILKTKENNPPKQESLQTTVQRVGETAENQRKTREKTKVAENQVFWLDFCAKKKDCAYLLRHPMADTTVALQLDTLDNEVSIQ